jgi:hypothetical protein
MPRSKVYHREPLAHPFGKDETKCSFELVAEVESNDLDTIFQLTNHIDHSWTENDGVRVLTDHRLRSTSVGDVVWLQTEDEFFVCESVGWKKASPEILGLHREPK